MAEGNANGNGARWYQTWVPILAASVVVLTTVSGYFSNQGASTNTLSNLTASVASLTERQNRMQQTLQSLELMQAENCRQLATVEVQMGTVETIINKTQIANQRDIALLWDKTYGQQYPSPFYAVEIPHEPMACMR